MANLTTTDQQTQLPEKSPLELRIQMAKAITNHVYLGLFVMLIVYALVNHESIIHELAEIITTPAVLVTDSLEIGGISGSFSNAILIFLLNYSFVKVLKIKITGLVIAGFFTVFGFCFFGKDILIILPFYVGGILYSYFTHTHFKDSFISIMFSTSLAPFVSEVAFHASANEYSYINAVILGTIIGFIVTPIARNMQDFHKGFNLYNLGFTAGILGAVMAAILKLYNFHITTQFIVSNRYDLLLRVILSSVFAYLILIGFYINGFSFKGYGNLLKDTGHKVDFVVRYGYGLTFINIGIMGFVAMAFVYITGGIINGPYIAGILSVAGFAAYGKHFKNTIPILAGIYLARFGTITSSFNLTLSGLFATALAPIAGTYGPLWGLIAGWLHLAVVQSIGIVHGGLNLYNNGFAAGIVAAVLLPVMKVFRSYKENFSKNLLMKRKRMYEIFKKDYAEFYRSQHPEEYGNVQNNDTSNKIEKNK